MPFEIGHKINIGRICKDETREKIRKANTCQYCLKSGLKGRKIHWANISQQYKREITDWIRLCASCHAKFDGNRGRKRIPQLALS